MRLRFRASSADRVRACPQSVAEISIEGHRISPFRPPDTADPAALMGTRVHAYVAALANEEAPPEPERLAEELYPDDASAREEFVFLAYRAKAAIEAEAAEHSGTIHAEVPLRLERPHYTVDGTADRLSVSPAKVLTVSDVKTGRLTRGHADQIHMYGLMALQFAPHANLVRLRRLWIREGEVEEVTLTSDQLHRWHAEFNQDVLNRNQAYHPGDHCRFCHRAGTCPGRAAWLSSLVIATREGDEPQPLTQANATELAPQIADALDACRAVADYERKLRQVVSEYIRMNGSLPIGDGTEFRLEERTSTEIVPEKAWPILSEAVGGEQAAMSRMVKITKTAAKREVMAAQPKGQKGAAWDVIEARMRDAGAYVESPGSTTLQRRRTGN